MTKAPHDQQQLADVSEPCGDDASVAMRALADLFANSKGPGGYRQYLLERIDGELVFRQTEFDALFEAVLAELFGPPRAGYARRIIKLSQL